MLQRRLSASALYISIQQICIAYSVYIFLHLHLLFQVDEGGNTTETCKVFKTGIGFLPEVDGVNALLTGFPPLSCFLVEVSFITGYRQSSFYK